MEVFRALPAPARILKLITIHITPETAQKLKRTRRDSSNYGSKPLGLQLRIMIAFNPFITCPLPCPDQLSKKNDNVA
jgi:hypothetical protein